MPFLEYKEFLELLPYTLLNQIQYDTCTCWIHISRFIKQLFPLKAIHCYALEDSKMDYLVGGIEGGRGKEKKKKQKIGKEKEGRKLRLAQNV